MHSNQGRNLKSQLFEEVLKLLQIKKTRTTAYRPSSNLGRMIKKVVSQHKQDWDQHLQLLVAEYQASPHPATGFSPNYSMFGREVNLSSGILFPFHRLKLLLIYQSMF